MRWMAVLGVVGLLGCPRASLNPEAAAIARTTSVPVSLEFVESAIRLPAGTPVLDPGGGVRVDVPEGWVPWRVESIPSMLVRLERPGLPPLRVEVHRGRDRLPEGGEGFFDRGYYVGGVWEDQVVAVWSDVDPDRPGARHMGVLLSDGGDEVVIESWLPDEEFEAAKRAFDAVVQGTTFER